MNTGKPKLLDQMKTIMRIKHYSLKTEKSYVHWVRRYIYFHKFHVMPSFVALMNRPFELLTD
ncbi:MAG: hypothetical protein GXP33_00565 [Spirochaetes bacterium]|nr:hypothetical protein [Spirochaetota bacterium]